MSKETKPTPGANKLLDMLLDRGSLKNDAALSRALEVAPPVISKIRHNKLPFGAALQIKVMRVFGLSLSELDAALA